MGKGKHQMTGDSICIIVIGTCFSLIKSDSDVILLS